MARKVTDPAGMSKVRSANAAASFSALVEPALAIPATRAFPVE
jgi:hypothetical protein